MENEKPLKFGFKDGVLKVNFLVEFIMIKPFIIKGETK